MSKDENTRTGKFLSLILRHDPAKIGIELDENGWASVTALLEKVNASGIALSEATLHEIVETNPKKRFAFNGDKTRIRASQGHSIDVDLAYAPKTPPEILYHGTPVKNLESIKARGLQKRSRHHVHLSGDRETAHQVGMRHGKPFILEIMAAKMAAHGILFYQSDNGVWLTDRVEPQYIGNL